MKASVLAILFSAALVSCAGESAVKPFPLTIESAKSQASVIPVLADSVLVLGDTRVSPWYLGLPPCAPCELTVSTRFHPYGPEQRLRISDRDGRVRFLVGRNSLAGQRIAPGLQTASVAPEKKSDKGLIVRVQTPDGVDHVLAAGETLNFETEGAVSQFHLLYLRPMPSDTGFNGREGAGGDTQPSAFGKNGGHLLMDWAVSTVSAEGRPGN